MTRNPYRGGYVAVNFHAHRIVSFITEIRAVEPDAGICIVDERIGELPPEIDAYDKVHFVHSGVLLRSTYEQAAMREQKAIIIFPPEFVSSADAQTRTMVDLVSHFLGKAQVRIMHIQVDPVNKELFEDMPTTAILDTLSTLAVVQECQDPHSSEIITRVLMNTMDANPFTVTPVRTIGCEWGRLQQACAYALPPCNVFALIKLGGQIRICPDPREVIEEGDKLSVVADKGFSWQQLEEHLKL